MTTARPPARLTGPATALPPAPPTGPATAPTSTTTTTTTTTATATATATAAAAPPAAAVTRPVAAVAVMTATLAVFVARPLMPGGIAGLMALFTALLVLGATWPLTADARVAGASARPTLPVAGGALVAGVAAFGLGRLLGGGHPPAPATARYIAAVTVAAVAEEVFFRRFVYAVLRPGGAALAVGGSAVLFAIAHVPVYGWWVLPLDLAAGLMLGWQRWASGTWAVPAVTHVFANLIVIL